jgi:hypothetical protein
VSGGSGRFFTPGTTLQKRIRIVDSCGDVFSDPGATPGASTNFFNKTEGLQPLVRLLVCCGTLDEPLERIEVSLAFQAHVSVGVSCVGPEPRGK